MGRAPSPKTRKYWKLQLDEMKRFDMTDEQKREFEVRELNATRLSILLKIVKVSLLKITSC